MGKYKEANKNNNIATDPDWVMYGTATKIEKELVGIKFKGPGVYLTKTDTVLILPYNRAKETFWYQRYENEEIFNVHVYNTEYYHTLLSVIGHAPNRQDDR